MNNLGSGPIDQSLKCLIPDFDGLVLSMEWKGAL